MMKFLEGLNWISILGILVAVETQIGNGTMSIVKMFPGTWVPAIQEAMGDLATIGALILARGAYGRVPVSDAPVLPPAVVKPIIILAVLIASMFAHAGSASAQILPKPRPAAAAPVDPLQKIMDEISAKRATFVSGVVAAIQEADDDAATLTNPADLTSFRDPIAHACYPAQIKFLQSLPQIQAIKAPSPYNLIVLFQRKRDLVAQIKAGLPGYLKVGCAALLKDEETIFVQTLGLIGVTIGAGALTGVFPAAAPIALPALTLPPV
jgi:hypothetical protein